MNKLHICRGKQHLQGQQGQSIIWPMCRITGMASSTGCHGDTDNGDTNHCDDIAPAPALAPAPDAVNAMYVDQVEFQEVDEELCGGAFYRPSHWHRCAGDIICEKPQDVNPGCYNPNTYVAHFCSSNEDCHRNGICKHGFCTCDTGFYGLFCECAALAAF